jgi:hypothetical protein
VTGAARNQTAQNHFSPDFSVVEIFGLGDLIEEGASCEPISKEFGVDLVRELEYPIT